MCKSNAILDSIFQPDPEDFITHFIGPLRDWSGDKLASGISIPKKPWKIIILNKLSESEWQPIIKELVNIQRKSFRRESVIKHDAGELIIPLTIPLVYLGTKPWHELLEEMIACKQEEKSKKQKKPNKAIQRT